VAEVELPKYWPILYVLYRLKRICNSFALQKYLYLAKVDGNAPIEYIFVEDYYGPCCSSIKQDVISLGDQGYIKVSFENGWVFEITEDGVKQVEDFINAVPVEVQKSFNYILEKYSALSMVKLRDYMCDRHIKPKPGEEYEQLKKQLLIEIDLLLSKFSHCESNGNSLFIRGSIDYCLLVLKRENLDDIQKSNLLTIISGYLKKIMTLKEFIRANPELLGHLCLNDLKEEFELTQEACAEYKVVPALFDENIDLSTFIEE
jgi:uncharacterized protein YwgA